MALYQTNLDDALLHGLFQQDGGVARLLEQVLNHGFPEFAAENSRQNSSFAINVVNKPWYWLSWRWLSKVSLRAR